MFDYSETNTYNNAIYADYEPLFARMNVTLKAMWEKLRGGPTDPDQLCTKKKPRESSVASVHSSPENIDCFINYIDFSQLMIRTGEGMSVGVLLIS